MIVDTHTPCASANAGVSSRAPSSTGKLSNGHVNFTRNHLARWQVDPNKDDVAVHGINTRTRVAKHAFRALSNEEASRVFACAVPFSRRNTQRRGEC